MDIKSILAQSKMNVLLRANPGLMTLAETMVNDVLEKVIPEITKKVEEAILNMESKDFTGAKGVDGYTPVKGKDYFTPAEIAEIKKTVRQGKDGKDGKDGRDGKNGRDGLDGIDGEKGKDGQNGKDGKDGSPDTPEQIAQKLNALEEKVDMKVIRGLTGWLNNIKQSVRTKSGGGGGMGNWITETPSGAINGSNTTFSLTSDVASGGKALILLYQGQVLEYGNQFTISGKTITTLFTPETGTVLFAMYART